MEIPLELLCDWFNTVQVIASDEVLMRAVTGGASEGSEGLQLEDVLCVLSQALRALGVSAEAVLAYEADGSSGAGQ